MKEEYWLPRFFLKVTEVKRETSREFRLSRVVVVDEPPPLSLSFWLAAAIFAKMFLCS